MNNSYGNTHVGRHSIFLIRKTRSNKGQPRGPRAAKFAPNNVIHMNEGGIAHVAVHVPNGGAVVTQNYKGRNIHRSATGKMFVLGSTGRRIYDVKFSKPVRKTRSNKGQPRGVRPGVHSGNLTRLFA
jgi:hypothetical protein